MIRFYKKFLGKLTKRGSFIELEFFNAYMAAIVYACLEMI
jgi:hypothetical protein